MTINEPSEVKYIQILGSPFRGKKFEEMKKKVLQKKLEMNSATTPEQEAPKEVLKD